MTYMEVHYVCACVLMYYDIVQVLNLRLAVDMPGPSTKAVIRFEYSKFGINIEDNPSYRIVRVLFKNIFFMIVMVTTGHVTPIHTYRPVVAIGVISLC